ncbi:pentapeptide repeat-containing protein [Streptomyces sp. NPDC102264]|uniref:pentapeptide repeat-containing protein n=1 Tax=Streptomyces sp. NPDC102264 TaxID=3366149 RepID=UPI00380C0EFB
MTRAELTRAELTRAELTRAELTRAELTRADPTPAEPKAGSGARSVRFDSGSYRARIGGCATTRSGVRPIEQATESPATREWRARARTSDGTGERWPRPGHHRT